MVILEGVALAFESFYLSFVTGRRCGPETEANRFMLKGDLVCDQPLLVQGVPLEYGSSFSYTTNSNYDDTVS